MDFRRTLPLDPTLKATLSIPGSRNVERDQRREIPGVLGAHTEGPKDGVRRSHPRRAVPAAARQEELQMQAALNAGMVGCMKED